MITPNTHREFSKQEQHDDGNVYMISLLKYEMTKMTVIESMEQKMLE